MHVYLAGGLDLTGGLEDDNRWIKKVVAGGGKESERVPVTKEQLESQHMVVMKEQTFFFVDSAGLGPFDGVVGKGKGKGKSKGKGDCGCCSEKQQPDVRCRRSAVVFLPFSVGRDVKECKRLLAGEAGKDGVLPAGVKARVEECLEKRLERAPPWLGEWGHSVAHCRGVRDGACSCGDPVLPVYVHEAGLHKFASEAWVDDENGLELTAVALRSGADLMFRNLPRSSYRYRKSGRSGGQGAADAERWNWLVHACAVYRRAGTLIPVLH